MLPLIPPPPAPRAWLRPRTLRRWALGLLFAAGLPASANPPASGPESEQRLPRLTCRAGYLEFEALRGVDGVRAAIRQAIEQEDQAALTFLGERLAEVIGKNPGAALQVLSWADTAAEPELSVLMRGLRDSEAVKDARVVSGLFTMAESHVDPGHQAQALMTLETQERFDAASMERLSVMARKDTLATGVAMHAARTLGRVMENDFKATGTAAPYMARLLDVARGSSEPDVRTLAVEMGTYPAARVDAASVKGLSSLLKGDPDPDVREMAALVMSTGRDTDMVLDAYREAFRAEKSLCVRLAILIYTLRAGGAAALPQVQDYARQDRRFEQDYADFKTLYGAGHTDFDRVWLGKKMYHQCPGEEGQP